MLFKAQDFENQNFSPFFESVLPSAEFLEGSTLDGGLSTTAPGLVGTGLRRHLIEVSAIDTLLAQQHVVRGLAMNTGVLSHYASTVRHALDGFDVRSTNSEAELAEQLATTSIGLAANILSSVPTLYTQLASAVLSLGLVLYDLFNTPDAPRNLHALPLQTYDDDTDSDHIKVHINRALKDRDLTSLFLPRFEGTLTLQFREDAQGRDALAFSLGNSQTGKDAEFHPTGHLGFIPGGRRVTSVIQALLLEPPSGNSAPRYDRRCGGCTWSGGPKTVARDVGSFYPSTNSAALTIWDHVTQAGPAMYEVDAVALQSAWRDYSDAWGDGLAWLWNLESEKDYWGTGMWRCALTEATRLQTVGIQDQLGVLSWAPFDGCDDLFQLGPFLDNSLFSRLVDRASMQLWLAQHYYLRHTTVAAYLHPDPGSAAHDPAIRSTIEDARRRILQTSERYEVRENDVVDADYKTALREAGSFVPSFERTLVPNETKRRRLTPGGLSLSSEAPDPPVPPNPGGGSPLPRPPKAPAPKKSTPGLAIAAGLGAAVFLLEKERNDRLPRSTFSVPPPAMAISDLYNARTRVQAIGSVSRASRASTGFSRSVISLLKTRQLHVDEATRRRIETCTDVGLLELWLARASSVTLAEDIFDDEKLRPASPFA